jgi:hypothetical protein
VWACDGTPDYEEVAHAASRWFGQSMEARGFP